PDASVAEALLKHPDGHLNLKYTLGRWLEGADCVEGDAWSYEPEAAELDNGDPEGTTDAGRYHTRLAELVTQVRQLSAAADGRLHEALGSDLPASADPHDDETADQWFQEIVQRLPG